jgi:hypothetical protein
MPAARLMSALISFSIEEALVFCALAHRETDATTTAIVKSNFFIQVENKQIVGCKSTTFF